MGAETSRWERARAEVLERWRRVRDSIRTHDEQGAVALINTMDEFCDEAIRSREAARAAAGDPAGTRCVFCRAAAGPDGCFGLLGEVNRAVFRGRWEVALCLAEDQIARLESLHFSAVPDSRASSAPAPGRDPGTRMSEGGRRP